MKPAKPRRVVLGVGLIRSYGISVPAFRIKDALGDIGIEILAVEIVRLRDKKIRLVAEILPRRKR